MSEYLINAEPLKSESPQEDFRPSDDSECFLCERGMAESAAGCWVEMTTSNRLVRNDITPELRKELGVDSQGCFPVGRRCTTKVPQSFRVKVAL